MAVRPDLAMLLSQAAEAGGKALSLGPNGFAILEGGAVG